jgi:hypothetical protein
MSLRIVSAPCSSIPELTDFLKPEWRRGERPGAVGDQRGFDAGAFIAYFDFGLGERRTGRIRYDARNNSAI